MRPAPEARLAALRAEVQRDLERIAHPTLEWMPARHTDAGERMIDVLVVGAGQGGLAVAFRLLTERVSNIRIVDAAPRGQEGAWRTYARMPTLRSPKDYTGPDLGVPSLTYRAWHEACFGPRSWEDLHLIPTGLWADYLDWFREVLDLPVTNEARLLDIEPRADHVVAHLRTAGGVERWPTRKLVLASGQDGTGTWSMPEPVRALPAERRAHCAEPIDFAALAGREVVVLGAGASAADNAIAALGAGAARVQMLCRRDRLQTVQPYRWLTFAGFLRHLGDLDDLSRWRFMRRILGLREGIPPDTYHHLSGFDRFELVTGAALHGCAMHRGRVRLDTGAGRFAADFVIAGTGIDVDFSVRPELARFAGAIRRWGDAFTPPAGEEDARLARYPYLGPSQELTERVPGQAPFLARLHDFTFGSTMSFGASGCSINAMKIAVPKLVAGVTRGLFTEDLPHHYASLLAYDTPMYELP